MEFLGLAVALAALVQPQLRRKGQRRHPLPLQLLAWEVSHHQRRRRRQRNLLLRHP